jgi:cysteine desulfurase
MSDALPEIDPACIRRPGLPIYFDYSATTPVDPRVATQMFSYLTEMFGNPASNSHAYGWEASGAVEQARVDVARLIGADAADIIWTSGATESNNLAIKGAAQHDRSKGRHLLTLATEHKSVLDSMHELEQQGFEVTYLVPAASGLIDPETFRLALRPDTTVASVMLVNNEIGVIQPVAQLAAICRERGIVFHVDAAQATGKVAIDLQQLNVDLMSFSAHKTYGPKGIGALYVRRALRERLTVQIHGGGHERGLRSGTLATHQIVGIGAAFRLAHENFAVEHARIVALRERLLVGLDEIPGIHINGDIERRVPHNLNISFEPAAWQAVSQHLYGIAVSSGSACTSAAQEPSYVLTAIGRSRTLANNAMRISVGRFTSVEDVDFIIGVLRKSDPHLR